MTAIHGDRAALGGMTASERLFCSDGRWYVRGDNGAWIARADERRAGGCVAPKS